MIKILDEFELNFIKFLNDKKYTDKEVRLSILHNYESVSAGDGGDGFAVYIPETKTIMLPTKIPDEIADMKEFVIQNLAHEYCHFIQDVTEREFNEEEADNFAEVVVNEYLSSGYVNTNTKGFVIVNSEDKYLTETIDWSERLFDAMIFDNYELTLEYKNTMSGSQYLRIFPLVLCLLRCKDENN